MLHPTLMLKSPEDSPMSRLVCGMNTNFQNRIFLVYLPIWLLFSASQE